MNVRPNGLIQARILAKLMKVDDYQTLLFKDSEIDGKINSEFKLLCDKVQNGYPLDYVIGEIEFCEKKFFINEHTLIPREETENWVNYVIHDLLSFNRIWQMAKYELVVDIGCGSGVIGLSLVEYTNKVILSDISESALEVAKRNKELVDKDNKAIIIKASLLDGILEHLEHLSKEEDWLLLANLPYVPSNDTELNKINKVEYEPK